MHNYTPNKIKEKYYKAKLTIEDLKDATDLLRQEIDYKNKEIVELQIQNDILRETIDELQK